MFITAIKEFRVQHDAPLDIMRIEWIGGNKMNRFRDSVGQLLKLAKEVQATRTLLDITSLADIPVFDQLWLSTHFMPVLLELPLRRVVVVISSKHVYNQHVVEGLLMAARPLIRFDVQYFTQADGGMYWLTDNTSGLRALLAEWEQDPTYNSPDLGQVNEPRARYRLS